MEAAVQKVAISLDPLGSAAQRTVADAVAGTQAQPVSIPPSELGRRVAELRNSRLLIYDLFPGTDAAASIVRECWLRNPELPILLYVPPSAHAGKLLTTVREVPSVTIELQLNDQTEAKRLQGIIQVLSGTYVRSSFQQVLQESLSGLPGLLWRLLNERIKGLEAGKSMHDLGVSTLASHVGVGIRRIEQVSRIAQLPPPKDLVDHVTLLWLAHGAGQKGWSTARFARESGVSTLALYRMRRRLLHRRSRQEMRDARAEFTAILRGLIRDVAKALPRHGPQAGPRFHEGPRGFRSVRRIQ